MRGSWVHGSLVVVWALPMSHQNQCSPGKASCSLCRSGFIPRRLRSIAGHRRASVSPWLQRSCSMSWEPVRPKTSLGYVVCAYMLRPHPINSWKTCRCRISHSFRILTLKDIQHVPVMACLLVEGTRPSFLHPFQLLNRCIASTYYLTKQVTRSRAAGGRLRSSSSCRRSPDACTALFLG